MITRFSWTHQPNDPEDIHRLDITYQKYIQIFLDPKYVLNKDELINLYEIDVRKLYDNFCAEFEISQQEIPSNLASSDNTPRYLDYQNIQLFQTPNNIVDYILDEHKIDHKCQIFLDSGYMLLDSNFEQLILIMRILEKTIEFNPLLQSDGKFNYSTQSTFPHFSTNSYIFTFNLSQGLPFVFKGGNGVEIIKDIIITISNPEREMDDFSTNEIPLNGYKGIFLSLLDDSNDLILKFHVTSEFTKDALLLDGGSIQKTSLLLLDLVLERLVGYDLETIDTVEKLRKAMEHYIV